MDQDILYHLALGSGSVSFLFGGEQKSRHSNKLNFDYCSLQHDLQQMFGDVKVSPLFSCLPILSLSLISCVSTVIPKKLHEFRRGIHTET